MEGTIMLTLEIPTQELFNNETGTFINIEGGTFTFEHSLRAIAKWESVYCKPFLVKDEKTKPELLDYFSMMCLDKRFDNNLLTSDVQRKLAEYISFPATATTFRNDDSGQNESYISSEVIYATMADLGIPFYCDKWNFNRLSALIRVLAIRHSPKKKRSRSELYTSMRALNEQRRKQMNSKG